MKDICRYIIRFICVDYSYAYNTMLKRSMAGIIVGIRTVWSESTKSYNSLIVFLLQQSNSISINW